jgi:hypothetical protein
VGLDAGAESIKAVAGVASRGGFVVLGCKIWRLSGHGDSPERHKHDILSWLRKFRYRRHTVVGGIYGQAIKYRYVSFPQVTRQEFQAAAALEAKSLFLSGENDHDLCVRTQIYSEGGQSGKITNGLVFATQQENLKTRRQEAGKLGLRRPIFYALAQSQCRLFFDAVAEPLEATVESPDKTHALIDLGAEYVKISIFRGKEIFLVREFSLPEYHADLSPYSLVDQKHEESETQNGSFADLIYLLSNGIAETNGSTVVSQQDPQVLLSLDAIGDEIKLTIKYFLANIENSVDAAWAIGGGACAQPAVDYLSNLLELPIRRVSLHDGFPIQADQTTRRELEAHWPVFYSALSLAYVEGKKEKSGRFTGGNKFPIAWPKWLLRIFPRRLPSSASDLAIALTVLLALVSLALFIPRRTTLKQLNTELERLTAERVALEDSVFSIKLLLPASNIADDKDVSRPPRPAYWSRLLYELGHQLPGDLYLSRISSERFEETVEAEAASDMVEAATGATDLSEAHNRAGDQITVKGTAFAYDAIAGLLHRIKQVPEFKNLSVEKIDSAFEPKTGAFDFTVVIKIHWN